MHQAAMMEMDLGTVKPQMAMAVVGKINELILQFIEQGKVAQLAELTACASDLVHAVTKG